MKPWSSFFTHDGTTTGTRDATLDFSAGSGTYYYVDPPSGSDYARIHRVIGYVRDSTGFEPDTYADTGTALTNGIRFDVLDASGTVIDAVMPEGYTVKTNADWSGICYDTKLENYGGQLSSEVLTFRWTFSKYSDGILIGPDRRLAIHFNDDMTDVSEQHFQTQGSIPGAEYPGDNVEPTGNSLPKLRSRSGIA